jgi:hypothetical protein
LSKPVDVPLAIVEGRFLPFGQVSINDGSRFKTRNKDRVTISPIYLTFAPTQKEEEY